MATVIDVEDVIEVRKAGLRALNLALGYEGAQAFMCQAFGGKGDYTKEKYDRPEPSYEEAIKELERIDAETRATAAAPCF